MKRTAPNPEGRLILCTARALVRVDKDGTRTILADHFEGKPLNGPNDLAVKSDGSVYFTDELAVYRWQPDGVKVDVKGNVYFGGPRGVWIVSPAGKHLGTIVIPGGHSNLAFGDVDGNGLYFTTGRSLARIRLNSPAI